MRLEIRFISENDESRVYTWVGYYVDQRPFADMLEDATRALRENVQTLGERAIRSGS